MALGAAVAAQRSVLDRIANPQVINPLAIQAGATQLAGQTYDLRAKQGRQVWGDALMQSIDPQTGQPDYQKAARIAQASGNPAAGYYAEDALKSSSTLSTEQLARGNAQYNTYGRGAATLLTNPKDANVNAWADSMISAGMPADNINNERKRVLAMSLPERQNYAQQHLFAMFDAHAAYNHQAGGVTAQDTGGEITPFYTTQPMLGRPGSMTAGPGVGKTLTPSEIAGPNAVLEYPATQQDVDAAKARGEQLEVGAKIRMPWGDAVTKFGYSNLLPPGARIVPAAPATSSSVTDSKGNKVGPTNPPRLLKVPGSSSTAAPPPAPAAAPTPAVPAPAPAPAASAPAAPAPALAPAAPASAPTALPGAPSAANPLAPPGVQVASASNAFAPNVGAPAAPAPAVTGDVAAILRGVNAARGNVQPAASFSVGPGYQSEASAKGEAATSTEKLMADDKLAASYASTIFPQAQALSLLGRGVTTAPNTDFINRVRGNVRGLLGQFGISSFDSTKEYDELHKWLTQIVVSNPVATGSDARLAETLAGNANTGIHQLASADMIKTGIALTRMQVAANSEWHSLSPAEQAQFGNNYNAFLRDYNKRVDPRAFAWDMLNPEQKKSLAEDLKKHDDAYAQKFLDTRDLARRNGLLDETRAMP